MQRRAPLWFTHGKTRERIHRWWPWAFGCFLGGLYWYEPAPFEEVRTASLAAIRRPALKGTEWLEVRDVDPETFALELPPDQIFGPLPLEQQMQFVLQALRDDNELADGYVTRLVIDHLDLSLDPPHLGKTFLESGAQELLDFAVTDFLGQRPPPAKNRFFDGDRLLRLLTICANQPELATNFVNKHNGVDVIFSALKEASDEYARVLACRSLTLFAMQQENDGDIEKRIIRGGHIPELVGLYRHSTGDPTDTRFVTMLISSMLRQHPKESYQELVKANVVKAAVTNLNISRYKGLPQHIRVIHDMEEVRQALLGKASPRASPLPQGAPDPQKRSRFQAMWAPKEDKLQERIDKRAEGATAADLLHAEAQVAAEQQKAELEEAPPANLRAPVPELLHAAEMLPVALGVVDIFPEYFEAVRELLKLVDTMRDVTQPIEFAECRFLGVAAKVVGRYETDAEFESQGLAPRLADMMRWVLDDKTCQTWTAPDSKSASREMRQAVLECRQYLDRRSRRLAEQAAMP